MRSKTPYPPRYCGQLTEKPFAVRRPAYIGCPRCASTSGTAAACRTYRAERGRPGNYFNSRACPCEKHPLSVLLFHFHGRIPFRQCFPKRLCLILSLALSGNSKCAQQRCQHHSYQSAYRNAVVTGLGKSEQRYFFLRYLGHYRLSVIRKRR